MAVYKEEKTNTWRVIYRYTDWTGERKQSQKRGFKAKREALAWEREQLNKATADLDMTFASFVEQYTADMKTRIKENTWATKDHIIRTKLLPYFGKLKMCNITAQQIITWQNEMLDHKDENGKKYSPVYLRSVNSQLSAIFNHQVLAERNNIDAISQTVIFLKEHHIGSPEELEKQIDDLQSACEERKAFIRQAQNRMKEINRQLQAIRDYRRTKEIYTQFRESGWSAKCYQEHRAEIEAHKKAQAVYELHDGKLPTLKELTAEYVALKGQLDAYKPDLAELKSKPTDLKHIRYNYKKLTRDIPQTDQYHRKGDRIER